jgi:hypothetical protein
MKQSNEKLKDRINKTVHKNCSKGLWVGLKKLEVKDCKIGDIVLTFSGSVFEISEISQNKNRENDLTIAVGIDDIAGSMYGSYKGVFPSLYKLEQV